MSYCELLSLGNCIIARCWLVWYVWIYYSYFCRWYHRELMVCIRWIFVSAVFFVLSMCAIAHWHCWISWYVNGSVCVFYSATHFSNYSVLDSPVGWTVVPRPGCSFLFRSVQSLLLSNLVGIVGGVDSSVGDMVCMWYPCQGEFWCVFLKQFVIYLFHIVIDVCFFGVLLFGWCATCCAILIFSV